MIFLGDIHGNYTKIPKEKNEPIIQVGDFGIGFVPYVPKDNVFFIRGNHDNPELCKKTYGYLGDYGYSDMGFYFISGASSVDWHMRTPNVDWWENEELSEKDFDKIIREVKKIKPKVIVSHDCPMLLTDYRSRTGFALDALFNIYQPDYWIFGHHHKSIRKIINHTQFIGLDIGECFYYGRE